MGDTHWRVPQGLGLGNAAKKISDGIVEELWFGDDDLQVAQADAAESFAAAMAKVRGLTPFPAIAQRIMQMAQDPDVQLEKVSQAMTKDPALAAKTLRLATSALFRVGVDCDTVDQAVVRLGMNTMYQMISATGVLGLFKESGKVGAGIRDHCVGVAAISRTMAQKTGWAGGGQVFLAGLMRDVGKLLVMQTEEFDYTRVPEDDEGWDRVHLNERERLGCDHGVLGGHVMTMWKMPLFVTKIVAWHHQPAWAYEEGGDIGLMVAAIRIADRLDTQIAKSPILDEKFLDEAAADAACGYMNVRA
ncbi:MAG: HDOD domain-containing protein [Polyangiaceae bacterium]|nr:HDOD domain-containing protein [Polyangiaceae bacterium]